MKDVEQLKQTLKDEGFLHIFEWKDGPDTEYEAHAHKGEVAIYILDGGLTFWFGEEEKNLMKGDRFDVPVGKEHKAKVGPQGCHFLVGEMIEGDT